MGFNIAGGIRAAAGFMQGQDEAAARDRATEDRKYQAGQREYQVGQQARTVAEQQRADILRADLAGIKSETTTDLRDPNAPQVDDEGTPSAASLPVAKTENVPLDAQLRQAAAAYGKAGDFANAIKHHQEADKVGWDRSSKMFQEVQSAAAASPDMPALDLANRIAKIFSSDPFGGKVTKVDSDGKEGVVVQVVNRETGQAGSMPFANKQAILEWAHSYYSPATYQALQGQRQAALIKAQEKLAEKPVTTVPGGYVDNATRKFHPTMVGSDTGMTDSEGNPIYSNKGAGGAAGPGKGKAPKELIDEAGTLIKDSMKPGDDPSAYLLPQSYLDGIYRSAPGTPPRTAAMIAIDAARDPSKVSAQINARDGSVSLVYANPKFERGRAFNLAPGGASIEDMEKGLGGPAKMVPAVQQMLAQQSNKETSDAIIKAAADPAYNAAILEQIKSQARPETLQADLQAWNTRVALVAKYMRVKTDSPKVERSWLSAGGLGGYTPDPNSPAGKAQAVRAQGQAQAASKTAAQQAQQSKISAQFQADTKTMAPLELARKYDTLRGQLPTADAAQLRAIEQQIR
jgi:hypothetical protein